MNAPLKPIRILLVDDHPLVRAGVRSELELLSYVQVVGEANNGRVALTLVRSLQPDVIFIDISMPGLNGLEALLRITEEFPEVRVIVLSMHENEEYVWRAMRAGAAGYLLKKAATAELGIALKNVVAGENYICEEIAARLTNKFPKKGALESKLEKLTSRQREILQLIAEGRNTKEIAETLALSTKTIEAHRIKLMGNLNIHTIPGLVRFAIQAGVTE
jgi:DNA-binding NarL/FixJ family response regulator